MRRMLATGIVAMLALGLLGVTPAQATHCNTSNATNCPNPLVVIVFEGIGKVCSNAVVVNTIAYGTKCTYVSSDPIWDQAKAVSNWNQTGYTAGTKYQGLFWPGVGPGAIGPYRLNIGSTLNAPNNVCVDSLGGPGCRTDTEGKLTQGDVGGQQTVGAYCGSSEGKGVFKYTASVPGTVDEGPLGWDQSAATILPVYGEVTKHNGVAVPSGRRATIRGFNSSRGVSASGNCGINDPTIGFQVEGFIVTF